MSKEIRCERRVDLNQAGMRLDQVAVELFPGYSRSRLQAWIRQGVLRVDGAASRPAYRLTGGELLELAVRPKADTVAVAQALPLDIIHQEAEFLIVDKPAGMVVHPAAGNPDGTLLNALLHHDPDIARVPRAGIVHRLDKDTSGIMVVARTLQAHAALVAQLQERTVGRIYQTVVHGLTPSQGTVDAPVGRHPVDRKRMAVVDGGKPAVTRYRTLQHFTHFSQLEVALESGRTHQIRVHMQHAGFPVVGDPTYGRRIGNQKRMSEETRDAVQSFPRQALHAQRLRLIHPATGETCRFEAPLPADMQELLRALERHDG